ncbi:MAG TPA: 6-phospho-beta-glucosidase [Candidatus Hydrogenedentes bacterium]|jgi:6-phospho-beta-glucosidase|nr:MAG: putative 6-phospho-beta-glucosidase [Candidatus Hydrogenedentes bacterium ADurb.Bin170]HPK25819.1 6-phospho-beta-glucosidase [Candidatus Hydrogenedentota bacterium]
MKLAIIGGGSSYSPELLDGLFARIDQIPVSEVWLMDPDEKRLEINAAFARRMIRHRGVPCSIHVTTRLEEALKEARYAITQIRVGQMAARIADEKLGLKYGIVGQETTGLGGFACALRTIPRILEIAHLMEEVAPDAFLINFTNPAGINTEAVIKHSKIRTVGLCNVPIGMIMDASKHLNYDPAGVTMDYVGLNHLSWVRHFYYKGEDVTDAVLEKFIEHARLEWEEEDTRNNMIEAIRRLGMFCNYYLQYYYSTDTALRTIQHKTKTRGEEVLEVENALFAKYQDESLSEKPEELSKRGGAHYSTAAFHLVEAIENNRQSRQVVCCRNNGAVPTFDDDVAVEVSAIIGKDGAKAIQQQAPAPSIRGLMQLVKAYESLTVEAAVKGDRDAAYEAMLLHPLMPNAGLCTKLLDELLEINAPWLQGTFF